MVYPPPTLSLGMSLSSDPCFKKTFPAKNPKAKVADYKLEAFFDKELGTDVFRGKIDSDEA